MPFLDIIQILARLAYKTIPMNRTCLIVTAVDDLQRNRRGMLHENAISTTPVTAPVNAGDVFTVGEPSESPSKVARFSQLKVMLSRALSALAYYRHGVGIILSEYPFGFIRIISAENGVIRVIQRPGLMNIDVI